MDRLLSVERKLSNLQDPGSSSDRGSRRDRFRFIDDKADEFNKGTSYTCGNREDSVANLDRACGILALSQLNDN